MAHGSRAFSLQRLTAGILRARISGGFLQPERMHAQHIAIPWHARIPMRQHLRDSIAQHRGGAQEEVADMRHLQREQIAWVLNDDVAIGADRASLVAVQPPARRSRMGAFTGVRLACPVRQRHRRFLPAAAAPNDLSP